MDRLATCPHCGGPEQVSPTCVTCGALLWFQPPVPDDVEDTADRVYPGLAATPIPPGTGPATRPAPRPTPRPTPGVSEHTVVRGTGSRVPPAELPPWPDSRPHPAPVPPRPAGQGRKVLGTALVVLLAAALVTGGWLFLDREREVVADRAPGGSGSTGQGEGSPDGDPAGAGQQEAAGCSGQYVLVTPAATDVPADCLALAAAVTDAAGEPQGGAATASYEGPFRSARVACRRRDEIGGTDVHVRQLSEGALPRLACACLIAPRKLPDLGPVDVAGAGIGRGVHVSDVQVLLHVAGYNPEALVGGTYGEQTERWVGDLQQRVGLPRTGRVDRATWKALLGVCG